ncbi:hypothetical protein D9758_004741 [Tetrapyrgos nigripes]|uniref:RING-type domain-containing protein n=1 Tax=Tetrapyrgos nigripes TaxID=182062 RepID=A0A8H5G5U1_9AGAR|nr:hypothetical protein D9758_004741 [Tetrapyrgos nigripes]
MILPKHRRTRAAQVESDSDPSDSGNNIEDEIQHVLRGVKQMKKQLDQLGKENQGLKEKLKQSQPEASSSSGRRRNAASRSSNVQKVAELEKRVKKLETARKKDRRKIEQLRSQAVKAEADDLMEGEGSDAENGVDAVHKMKKLLRKFSDLVIVSTLSDEGEECPICFDNLEVKKTSGLQCEHLVCNDCLAQISKGSDETVQCPYCKQVCAREDVELVHYTERERWDALLDVAKAWCAMDHHAGEETSEEEAEEEFINDGTSIASTPANNEESELERIAEEDDDEDDDKSLATPPPADQQPQLYAESPTKLKRQRMEQLSKERQRKKGRFR